MDPYGIPLSPLHFSPSIFPAIQNSLIFSHNGRIIPNYHLGEGKFDDSRHLLSDKTIKENYVVGPCCKQGSASQHGAATQTSPREDNEDFSHDWCVDQVRSEAKPIHYKHWNDKNVSRTPEKPCGLYLMGIPPAPPQFPSCKAAIQCLLRKWRQRRWLWLTYISARWKHLQEQQGV